MQNRWFVLGVLFLARMTMAFQFQVIAAVSPLYMQAFGVGLSDIGLMIGLYLAPGLVFAYPGGAIGARLGDKRAVTFGMILMVAGGVIMAVFPTWAAQIGGRVLAGIGGILLNVLMSKMVTDRFTGREISTAMGLFVTSWPVGIALALVAGPLVAAAGGLDAALWAAVLLPALGLVLFVTTCRPVPAGTGAAAGTQTTELAGPALVCILLAGAIWGLYNAALSMVFGFGPAMLADRGWSLQAGSFATSLVLWLALVSIPLGGIVADRTGHRDLVLITGVVVFALSLVLAAQTDAIYAAFILIGLVGGVSAGPIMSLPSEILEPGNRGVGMGLFYSVFYVGTVFAPMLAGDLADRTGTATAPFLLGAVLMGMCLPALSFFRRIAPRAVPDAIG